MNEILVREGSAFYTKNENARSVYLIYEERNSRHKMEAGTLPSDYLILCQEKSIIGSRIIKWIEIMNALKQLYEISKTFTIFKIFTYTLKFSDNIMIRV